jgi:hypothetical protein
MLHAFQKAISKTLEFDSCIVLRYHGDKSALENLHQNLFLSQANSLSSINLSKNKFNKFPLDLSKFSKQNEVS